MNTERFDEVRATGRNYVTVLEDVRAGRVIGSGTLLLEHSLSLAVKRARASRSDSHSDSHAAPASAPLALDSLQHLQLDERDIYNLKCASDAGAGSLEHPANAVERCAAPSFVCH